MGEKLKWKVDPPPTGKWRCFEKRGWPMAYDSAGEPMARMTCEDEYEPKRVKAGRHREITVWMTDRRPVPEEERATRSSWKWRKLNKRAATVDEAKELAQKFFDANPTFFGRQSS